jgi:hypothetical protein
MHLVSSLGIRGDQTRVRVRRRHRTGRWIGYIGASLARPKRSRLVLARKPNASQTITLVVTACICTSNHTELEKEREPRGRCKGSERRCRAASVSRPETHASPPDLHHTSQYTWTEKY